MAWPTAGDTLNQAGLELGILEAEAADPYAVTNANIVQLRSMLTATGRALLLAHPWSHLQHEYTFPTVASTAEYALPSDFLRYRDGTGWNRTQRWPLTGPLNDAQWQMLQAQASTGLVTTAFRIWENQVVLYPTPSAIETVAYEYASKWWVSATAGTEPTKEEPDAATDILYLDKHLLERALMLRFLTRKGFPAQDAQNDYDAAWASATGGDGAAPVLSLNGGWGMGRMLDASNVPETGFGS